MKLRDPIRELIGWEDFSQDNERHWWRTVLRRDPCAYCGVVRQDGDPQHEVDHIRSYWRELIRVPAHVDGRYDFRNMTGACRHCNRSKKTRTVLDVLLDEPIGPRVGYGGRLDLFTYPAEQHAA